MSNELELVNADDIAALAAATGASKEDMTGGGGFIPNLKVNYDDDDDDDENAPRLKGKLFITGQEPAVFADKDSVVFRPLIQTFQWTQYSEALEKVLNKTKLVTDLFKDEARDELGTVKCGKPTSKALKANPALAKKYEDITCYRTVQGYVSYTGTTKSGDKVEVKDVLVGVRLKGANFAPFSEEHIEKLPAGAMLWDYPVKLSVTKEKNGASTYFVIHFDGDFTEKLPFTMDVFNTIKELKTNIDAFNKEVDKKYYTALESKSEDDGANDAIASAKAQRPKKGGGLEDDLKDDSDIPF